MLRGLRNAGKRFSSSGYKAATHTYTQTATVSSLWTRQREVQPKMMTARMRIYMGSHKEGDA